MNTLEAIGFATVAFFMCFGIAAVAYLAWNGTRMLRERMIVTERFTGKDFDVLKDFPR